MIVNDCMVVNLGPIATGGGLQNAKSLLEVLAKQRGSVDLVLVRSNSELEKSCRELGLNYLTNGSTVSQRMRFEFSSGGLFDKYSVCFTLFGPPPLSARGKTVNVAGCAYSNLFYPEIPFWSYLPLVQRSVKGAIDQVRRTLTTAADFWIFETEVLRKRAIELCNFPSERVAVVRMAPSKLVSRGRIKEGRLRDFSARLPEGFNILYLSGAHPNKRLHMLPQIAQLIAESGCPDFAFVTTMDERHSYAKEVMRSFEAIGLERHLVNLGPVLPDDVSNIIEACDAMCTLSLLESFSNNFVEAWQMGKPIIVTDADWSRDSCGEGALYIDPADAERSAHSLVGLIGSEKLRNDLVASGTRQLASYHTPESKFNHYMTIVSRARELGPLPAGERRRISWP